MNNLLGPVGDSTLLPGEKVAISRRRVLSRKGRCVVRVRIFGSSSLGWLDSFILWGACVEAFVCQGGNVKHLIHSLYPGIYVAPLRTAKKMSPHNGWGGIVAGTLSSLQDIQDALDLLSSWSPSLILFTIHRKLPRKIQKCLSSGLWSLHFGNVTSLPCHHDKFGGVTTSSWTLWIGVKSPESPFDLSLNRMTAGLYTRHLQTALDDTIGPPPGRRRLEKFTDNRKADYKVGSPLATTNGGQPVYDASALAPDLSHLTRREMQDMWVLAVSVFSKTKVLRKISLIEFLAIWDYAGKIWYQGMSTDRMEQLLQNRLLSPPGKILKAITFNFCHQILESILPSYTDEILPLHSAKPLPLQKGLMEVKGIQRAKAALPDDAGVELAYWALPNETQEQTIARNLLRRFSHAWWVMNLTREAYTWLAKNGSHPKDRKAIEDCLRRAAGSDFWEWHRGSRLFFWRFPAEDGWRRDARDGVQFWHLEDPPTGLHFQNIPTSTRDGELQIRAKVLQLKYRWYLEEGPPDLVTPRFAVEKAVDESGKVLDIRCVWDAKRNGLNATLWCPKFSVPTTLDAENLVVKWLLVPVGEYLRSGSPPQDYSQDESLYLKSWQFDHDIAQQFNNFVLHEKERHSHGIKFISTRNDGGPEEETFLQLCVLNFGCLCNPYVAVQGEERILELAQGDPEDPTNPFHFHECWMNLPTSLDYDPSMPRVLLLKEDGELATRRVTFIDDLHGVSRSRDGSEAGEAARILACKMNYYGNQCAARKFGPPTLIPRPWNGIMTHTDTPYPVKGTTAKKWTRGLAGLAWVWRECGLPDDLADPIDYIKSLDEWDVSIDTAELRRIAGLWVHLTELYTEGRCFLKGYFNAMEAFRSDRDLDGWRLEDSMESARALESDDASREVAAAEYPLLTRVTYQLVLHTHALRRLFHTPEPRVAPIRPDEKHQVRYACGDASAEGFAQAVQYPDLTIDERDGLWLPEYSAKSSNLREALNIANHLKRDIQAGKHDGCEVWQATDNAVWSAVCNKGMSSVRHLFDLFVDIKILCHEHNVFYHCFHISGERMISTGIDGLSRGDHRSPE